jgi:hypothetical protein
VHGKEPRSVDVVRSSGMPARESRQTMLLLPGSFITEANTSATSSGSSG